MAIEKVGLNLTGLYNVTTPQFNISSNPTVILNDVATKVNEATGYLLGYVILFTMFFLLLYHLRRRDGKFNYGSIRALGISAGCCSIIGIVDLMAGVIQDIRPVGLFIGILLIVYIYLAATKKR